MKLKPLADRVILKQFKAEEKTKSGLILAASAQEKPEMFEVVEVGPGGMVDGNEVKMTVAAGDRRQVLRHHRESGRRGIFHRASGRHSGCRRVIQPL